MEYSDQKELDGSRFATVLRNLKRENIPSLASRVRRSGQPSTGIIDNPTTSQPTSCELLPQITCGSFNAVFKIKFTNGTRWVLKVPAIGHHQFWDAPASEALTSEALTMRLIKRETTIPIPQVFAFDASLENELGCPFVLMEHVKGKPLHDVWWNQSVSQARREQFRVRSLHDIAEAMTQLNNLTFSQGGSLLFDDKGNVSGIGSSSMFDLETQYANLRSPDYDDSLAFCQIGPFSDPKSHLFSLLDNNEGKSERSTVSLGACKLLRLFIEWSIMRIETNREKPFVLSHPDLDSQNIFVDDDGTLTGIIDVRHFSELFSPFLPFPPQILSITQSFVYNEQCFSELFPLFLPFPLFLAFPCFSSPNVVHHSNLCLHREMLTQKCGSGIGLPLYPIALDYSHSQSSSLKISTRTTMITMWKLVNLMQAALPIPQKSWPAIEPFTHSSWSLTFPRTIGWSWPKALGMLVEFACHARTRPI